MLEFTEKGGSPLGCCKIGLALKEEYENALKFEALAYARLITHKRRHSRTDASERSLRHMQMVRELADRYTEGDVEAHAEIPSTGSRELEI